MFQTFCFNDSLTTFKKAAAEYEILDRLPILDARYQCERIITITLSYNSQKNKSWFVFTKSGHTLLRNMHEFKHTVNLSVCKTNIFDGVFLYASKHCG